MKQRYGASVEELLTRRDKAAEELKGTSPPASALQS